MKSLKKVPPGAKGLRKLPTSVRNKMGYMQKGGKVTKKMVDEEFTSNMNSSMNLTNELAKRASTGLKKNGFPMKPAAAKALKKEVARRKKKEQKAKPNYRYVGTNLPAGPAPFEDDGMPKTKNGMKAVKKYGKGGQMYQKGGKVKKPKGSPGSGVIDYGNSDMVGLDLASAERRVAQNAKFAKNNKNYGTEKFNRNIDRERVAGRKKTQQFETSDDQNVKRLRRTDPKAYNRIVESLRSAGESEERTRQIKRKRDNMKKGGKIVKYQSGGKSVMLDAVTVKGKKGAGVREQGVVARGKTGAEFTKHRNELINQFTSDYIRKKKRHPNYKLNDREKSDVMDKVRAQMYKDGYQEQGVVRKDTKERLSPGMEKAAKDRLRRK